MKTNNNLYERLCSIGNLRLAFRKAGKDKSNKPYVKEFKRNLNEELERLKKELETQTYRPGKLKRFIIRDPKTRTIHASDFRDRVVYHALCNLIEPIFEKVFIYDSYASRLNKGTHTAVERFCQFMREVTKNGRQIKNAYNNNTVTGYCLKADIKHYFDTVDHEVLINIVRKKVTDEKVIWLIKIILDNFDNDILGKGMPLGNLTSQFFANVYLNELDYFVKHIIKVKYYIRYVDDFVILNDSKEQLVIWKEQIHNFLNKELKLELHPDKSSIIPLSKGLTFLGYKIFYHYKLLRKSNIGKFERNFDKKLNLIDTGLLTYSELLHSLQGWFGYARWANTYRLKREIMHRIFLHRIQYPCGPQTFK